jgi:sporulation protein YlmC with PRC-barrel domain
VQVTLVPNITNICYGRGVGYKIEEIVLDEKTQQISATKIREQMRKEGKLK